VKEVWAVRAIGAKSNKAREIRRICLGFVKVSFKASYAQ